MSSLEHVSAALLGAGRTAGGAVLTRHPQAYKSLCGVLELKKLFIYPTRVESADTFLEAFTTSIRSSAEAGKALSMIGQACW